MATQKFKNAWLDGFNLELERLSGQEVVSYQNRRLRAVISDIKKRGIASKQDIRKALSQFNLKAYDKSIVANYLGSGITDLIQNNKTNQTRLLLDRNPLTTARNVFNTSVAIVENRIPEPLETVAVYVVGKGFAEFKKNALKNIQAENKLFEDNVISDLRGDVKKANQMNVEIADYLDTKWIKKKIEQPYNWTETRIRRLVDTQLHANGELAKLYDAEEKGRTRKMWVTQGDSKVRTSHNKVNGKKIDLDQKFKLDGGMASYPSERDLPAKERMNCRCFLVYTD